MVTQFRNSTTGRKNVAHPTTGVSKTIYWRPSLIKLGLIKVSVKAMDKESEGVVYLRQKFPKIRKTKTKQGIFFGVQITQLF
jgi:hypothetical protein